MPSLSGARSRHTQPVWALPVFLCCPLFLGCVNESPGPVIPRISLWPAARTSWWRNPSWPPAFPRSIERSPVSGSTGVLHITPTRHPVLEFHDACPGRLAGVRPPGPLGGLQRYGKAYLGVMQGQSVPQPAPTSPASASPTTNLSLLCVIARSATAIALSSPIALRWERTEAESRGMHAPRSSTTVRFSACVFTSRPGPSYVCRRVAPLEIDQGRVPPSHRRLGSLSALRLRRSPRVGWPTC
jgi:hypothetical protein